MKYVGMISVVDEQGIPVFERELGTYEIIAMLLERIDFFQKPPEAGEGLVVGPHNVGEIMRSLIEDKPGQRVNGKWTCCGRKGYKHDKNCEYAFGGKLKKVGGSHGGPKPCCGSLGNRHKKDCGGTAAPAVASKNPYMAEFEDSSDVDYLITEGDFNDIKDAQHNEMTSIQAASELNLDTIACIRAFACKTWSDYRLATRKAK